MQMSSRSISRLFKNYLNEAPAIAVKSKINVHLIIDGTYLPNGLCVTLYYDHDIRYVQLYRTGSGEKLREIIQDLKGLKSLGVQVYSVTGDGHKSILKAIAKVYPGVIIQRCLVHVKRQCGLYLSKKPKLYSSQELLVIVNQLSAVKTFSQCSYWLLSLHNWYQQYKDILPEESINEQTGDYWKTHDRLHRAYTHLHKAIPYLFCYLNDPEIPATSNRLWKAFLNIAKKSYYFTVA